MTDTPPYDLQDQLEQRYGPALSQQILEEIRKTEHHARSMPAYGSELRELSELVKMFRAQAVQSLWRLRSWRKREDYVSPNQKFIQMEGEFLARQLSDSVALYRQGNHHYHQALKLAMSELKTDYYKKHAA